MDWDVIVIGAGAAGMMCAAVAGRRGRKVLVLEHGQGAGREDPHLRRRTLQFHQSACHAGAIPVRQSAFLHLGAQPLHPAGFHRPGASAIGIAWHEKTLGQLFCDGSAGQIIDMLLAEMKQAGAQLRLNAKVQHVEKTAGRFHAAAGVGRSAGMQRAGGGDGRQVHSQDGRHRFRLSAGRAVRRSGDRNAARPGAADLRWRIAGAA